MTIDMALVFAFIIAFGLIMYVVMDGFDLGVGILYPFFKDKADRDVMMNTIAPVWDGNETWLVLGGVALFGAFPMAYAVILPALYLPLMLMLLALIFRGVAFEFRFKASRTRPLWDFAFAAGSTIATFCQGLALGAFVQGIKVSGRSFAGGTFDWLSAFTLFTGCALVAGYAMLGCAWLIMKTEGSLRDRLFAKMWPIGMIVLAFVAGVSLWTPFHDPQIMTRWFSWPNIAFLSPVPILVGLLGLGLVRAVQQRDENKPFLFTLGLFLLSYVGLAISMWPNIIPPAVSIWDAAGAAESHLFLIVGMVILIPVILTYTAYNYWVFRGKIRADAGYH